MAFEYSFIYFLRSKTELFAYTNARSPHLYDILPHEKPPPARKLRANPTRKPSNPPKPLPSPITCDQRKPSCMFRWQPSF